MTRPPEELRNYHGALFTPAQRYAFAVAGKLRLRPAFYSAWAKLKTPRSDILPFRDKHAGQRCFIMGGGPSLKLIDPEPLRHEFTFGVNGIFLIFDWLGFQPTYYAVEDWLVYEDRQQEIAARITAPQCFFPLQFAKPGFTKPNHHYMNAFYDFAPIPDWPRFSTDLARQIWIGGTVTYVCLQLAYYMGFHEVYLIGMDHNYAKPDHVQTKGREWTSQGADPNHFHPDYFGKGYRWHDPMVERMEVAYRKARRVYEADGRRVFNATVGGKLEVFDRVDFATLFPKD